MPGRHAEFKDVAAARPPEMQKNFRIQDGTLIGCPLTQDAKINPANSYRDGLTENG